MLFAAQLWKYNGERLENKNGDWRYMEETWILPSENKTDEVRKSSKRGLAKLFSYKTKEVTDYAANEGQAIRNFRGSFLNAYPDFRGMHQKIILDTYIMANE